MRISEIIPYINVEKMSTQTLIDICSAFERMDVIEPSPGVSALEMQYGDELHDIEVEQARLDLEQTKAEIAKLRAEAAAEAKDADRYGRA